MSERVLAVSSRYVEDFNVIAPLVSFFSSSAKLCRVIFILRAAWFAGIPVACRIARSHPPGGGASNDLGNFRNFAVNDFASKLLNEAFIVSDYSLLFTF